MPPKTPETDLLNVKIPVQSFPAGISNFLLIETGSQDSKRPNYPEIKAVRLVKNVLGITRVSQNVSRRTTVNQRSVRGNKTALGT